VRVNVPGWSRLMRYSVVGAIIGVIVLLLVLSIQAREELRLFQEEPVDNIHWNVTQLELDILRLQSEAALAAAISDRNLDELRLRFDLVYSRARNFGAATMFGALNLSSIVAPINERMQDFLDRTAPLIDGSDAILRNALPAIEAEARQLRLDFREMAVRLVDEYAAIADGRRAGLTDLLQRLAWASLAFVGLLGVVLTYVLRLNAQSVRRNAEIARVSSRLQATVDTALDGVIVADLAGRVIDYNNAAAQIFGYTREEAVGRLLDELIVPARHIAAHRAGMARIAATGEKRVVDGGRIQMAARRRSGEEFAVEMSIASSDGVDGMIFIAYLRDISQRLADENALRDARDEALAAERAKNNFIAVMSHEMRTPLNGVMASLEIAKRRSFDAEQDRFLGMAQTSARQLLRHVNDVLDISKVEGGHMPLVEEDFDLHTLVRDLVEPMRATAAEVGTVIETAVLSDLPMVRGDMLRLGQVVTNLVTNAIKFTVGGMVSIEIEAQSAADETVTVEIRVTDTGIGIAEEDLDRVFDDFVMVDPSFRREAGGTGLGLAISRRLIEAMGGQIGAEAELGEGSCFWLRVPLRRAHGSAVTTPPPAGTEAAALDLLVVEDNPTNRLVLEEMLRHMGYRVTLAADGAEGVRQASLRRFDVVLMDISMPGMDGLTATGLIRAEGLSRASRIVAVTAHTLPADLARFREAGMDACLTKPINGADLRRALYEGREDQHMQRPSADLLVSSERQAELAQALGPEGATKANARYLSDMERIFADLSPEVGHSTADIIGLCHEAAGASATIGASRLQAHFAGTEQLASDRDAVAPRLAEAREIFRQTAAILREA